MDTNKHENLLYKELSYQIQGAAIEVRKNFGPGLKESIYQNAFAEELKSRSVQLEKEKPTQIFSPKTGRLIGSYRPDFIIDDKIIVELKAVEKIPKMFLDQIFSYLRNSKYELGYFINFASPNLYTKRIIFTNDRKAFLRNTQKGTNIKRIVTKLSCLLVFLFVFFSVSLSAEAAEMSFDAKATRVQISEKFEVNLFVNAEQESINAFEGKIIFPSDILDLKEIRDGNSIVNFWIDRPMVETLIITKDKTNGNENISNNSCPYSCGFVSFSGVTPGGFNGGKGLIFSAIFEANKEGVARFEINDARVLRNDGTGSEVTLIVSPFEVVVSKKTPAEIPAIPKVRDRERPESFMPEIAKDGTLFDGKWFIVFATQDKASGIDNYEIKESRQKFFAVFKKWLPAESPHVLQDQELRSFVSVKAIDKAGNERIIKIAPRNPLAWYENYENWIMIIVGLLIIVFAARKLWRIRNTK